MSKQAIVYTGPEGSILADAGERGIAEVLDAGDAFAEYYVPILTSSGAGVLALVGQFAAHAVKDGSNPAHTIVMVRGTFHFTRAAAGVAETITITLPPTMLPTAVFAAASNVTGDAHLNGIHAATDFCGTLIAVVAARTVSVPITDNAASSDVAVFFSYRVA